MKKIIRKPTLERHEEVEFEGKKYWVIGMNDKFIFLNPMNESRTVTLRLDVVDIIETKKEDYEIPTT